MRSPLPPRTSVSPTLRQAPHLFISAHTRDAGPMCLGCSAYTRPPALDAQLGPSSGDAPFERSRTSASGHLVRCSRPTSLWRASSKPSLASMSVRRRPCRGRIATRAPREHIDESLLPPRGNRPDRLCGRYFRPARSVFSSGNNDGRKCRSTPRNARPAWTMFARPPRR